MSELLARDSRYASPTVPPSLPPSLTCRRMRKSLKTTCNQLQLTDTTDPSTWWGTPSTSARCASVWYSRLYRWLTRRGRIANGTGANGTIAWQRETKAYSAFTIPTSDTRYEFKPDISGPMGMMVMKLHRTSLTFIKFSASPGTVGFPAVACHTLPLDVSSYVHDPTQQSGSGEE